ncbi:ABC transporter permease [Candidatus Vondammii sp. HM_W22]
MEKRLLIAALRSVIQLLLLGMVLKTLFSQADLLYIWPSPHLNTKTWMR